MYGYAKFSTLLGNNKRSSIDPSSQVEKKINFFFKLSFHLCLEKRHGLNLDAVKDDAFP